MMNYNNVFSGISTVEREDPHKFILGDKVSAAVAKDIRTGIIRPRGLVYKTDIDKSIDRGSTFNECDYNLGEIARAIDTDAYIAQSMKKRKMAALKNGWFLDGKDKKALEYIKDRLDELSHATNIPLEVYIRNSIQDITYYNNTFTEVKRSDDFSSGSRITRHGKRLKPISGIFNMDATSMKIRRKPNGTVSRYMQEIEEEGKTRSFAPEAIVHMFRDRKHGLSFGTPDVVPVLDDVRALRRIEQLAEMLSHRHTFPFLHHVIGTDNAPCTEVGGTGKSEIDLGVAAMEGLPQEGFIVTSERHKIAAIETNQVLDVKPFLDYFEARALSGLDISDVDLGRGGSASKSTANTISKNTINAARDIQAVFMTFFNFYIIEMLMIEGGFKITEGNRVRFKFHEVDPEEKQAKENHAMALWQGNMVTQSEARNEMGREQLTDEQLDDMFNVKITQSLEQLKVEGLVELAKISPGQTGQSAQKKGSNKNPNEPSANKTRVRNQPRNQFGTKRSAISPTKNDSFKDPSVIMSRFLKSYLDKPSYVGVRIMRLSKTLQDCFIKHAKESYMEGVLRCAADLRIDCKNEDFDVCGNLGDQHYLSKIKNKCNAMKATLKDEVGALKITSLSEAVAITLDSELISVKEDAELRGFYGFASSKGKSVMYSCDNSSDEEMVDKDGSIVKDLSELVDLNSRFKIQLKINDGV